MLLQPRSIKDNGIIVKETQGTMARVAGQTIFSAKSGFLVGNIEILGTMFCSNYKIVDDIFFTFSRYKHFIILFIYQKSSSFLEKLSYVTWYYFLY
jgi:hypothetical protein